MPMSNDSVISTPVANRFYDALLLLKSRKEAQTFMRDLLTEAEIAEFSNRLRAAELLLEKVPYSAIEKETGMSSTTIARISKWLNNGMGGYKLMLNKLNVHHHTPPLLRKG